MGAATKISDASYPGFAELAKYIDTLPLPDYWDGEGRLNIHGNSIEFANSGKQHYGGYMMGNISDNDSEMTKVLNTQVFRFVHNLLPAGTDVVTAFCQIMALKYRNKMVLSGASGTYRVIFHVWTSVTTHKNEAQLSQQVMFSYTVDTNSKADFEAIICL